MVDCVLPLRHGALRLPAFLPDATVGVVRGVDASDLEACGVEAVVMNTFHLMQRPGSSTVGALGGLHRMAGWERPIVTDSGGFQAYSLIRQQARPGRIDDEGITVQPEGAARKFLLTPEKSIRLQVAFGADIVVCLDDCTDVAAAAAEQETAVRRTVAWAKRCRKAFDELMQQKRLDERERPRLFAVVQGGGDRALRRACAEELLAIGFDGYGYGGWPLDSEGRLLTELIAYTRELIGPRWPMHALGVGSPSNVVACARAGYEIFDSALPTRDARHGRLYVWDGAPPDGDGRWWRYLYINDEKHYRAAGPLAAGCDCLCCRRYSTGYLHHLHTLGDALYTRLATLHNLRTMTRLTAWLRDSGLPR